MTSTTENSDVLVREVLDAMRRGAGGDGDAVDALRKHSSKDGNAEEERPKPAPAANTLVSSSMEITRPNGEIYHVRKLGEHHDVAVLQRARTTGINPLLTGMPGTGKTALIEAAYASTGQVYTLQGTGDTEWSDFVGGYVQLPDGKFKWIDGPLVLALKAGAVLYIDEIALIDPKVLAGVYGVMDGRGVLHVSQNPEMPEVKAEPGFFVAAACNPNAPGARMSEALLSRFVLQFEVTTDYTLARKFGVDSRMITAAQNMQKKVDNGGSGLSWAPQLRELIAFVKISKEFGDDIALRNMVMTAPEMERSIVADLISRTYHKQYKELRVS